MKIIAAPSSLAGSCMFCCLLLVAIASHADELDSWFVRSSGTTEELVDVSFANGRFTARSSSGAMLTSADGSVWSGDPGHDPSFDPWLRLTPYSGSFSFDSFYGSAAGAGHNVYVVRVVVPAPPGQVNVRIVAFYIDGSRLLLVFSLTRLNSIAYGNGSFVAVGRNGTIVQSEFFSAPPMIDQEPQDQEVSLGATAIFSVTATGPGTLGYQWKKDEDPILGATNSALAIEGVHFSDAGYYSVEVSNAFGVTASQEAFLSVTQPPVSLQPLLQGKWSTGGEPGANALDVKVVGNYAYVALRFGGLAVIDVRNSSNCVRVGGCSNFSANAVAVSGNYAYVADELAGLVVVDVSNPTNCVRVGGYDAGGYAAYGVAVSGNYAYLANSGAGLQVIDVSNPTNCVRVGGYDTVFAYGVAVSSNYAYVAGWTSGLQVIDVSNPTNCVRVGGLYTRGVAQGVAVSDHYAYVASAEKGLHVIDVRNPTNCVRVGGLATGGFAYSVALSGKYAYLADGGAGLQVIEVSNPTNCVRVGGYKSSGYAWGTAVVADRIYVADAAEGLVVLPALPNVQFTVRVNATPSVPFTIEAATNLNVPIPWTPLLTTNVPSMPFD